MRTFGVAAVYVLGLLGLGVAAASFTAWPALVAIALGVFAWSTWFGFVARRWTALLAPICVAVVLVPMMIAVASGASGDGGAEAAAGMLFVGVAVALAQTPAIGLGVVASYFLRGPLPPPDRAGTH